MGLRRLRKDDTVMVIAGKERGKTGKVLRVLPEKNRVLIEHVNMVKRHAKPRGVQTRIGHKILGDGRKVRVCRKCEGVVDK